MNFLRRFFRPANSSMDNNQTDFIKTIYFWPRHKSHPKIWIRPAVYILLAGILSQVIPLVNSPKLIHTNIFTTDNASTILSTISGGMISFTGIVLSLAFLFLQFSSSAYSPRLASSFFKEPSFQNAVGIFIGTFVFSILTLYSFDFKRHAAFMDFSMITAFIWLIASMIAFLKLIQLISQLQITSTLQDIGNKARRMIPEIYPKEYHSVRDADSQKHQIKLPPVDQIVYYRGGPCSILSIDYDMLAKLAASSGGMIEMDYGVGDTIPDQAQLLRLRGAVSPLNVGSLSSIIKFGAERTIEQDPRYAIRLIVDIAIHALSPAINDPTTAVQALDQIDDILRRIGTRELNLDYIEDESNTIRVILPSVSWDDYLSLSIDEIRCYGSESVQITRRLKALLEDLEISVPEDRRPAVKNNLDRLKETVENLNFSADDKREALQSDRQGIGMTRNSTIKSQHNEIEKFSD